MAVKAASYIKPKSEVSVFLPTQPASAHSARTNDLPANFPNFLPLPQSLDMILVHKPQSMLSSPCAHHRRHPSAPPAVVVQPTRIPGLLSLSKPVKPQQQRQRSAPKVKQLATSLAKATPELEVLKPSPEIIVKSSARGRQNKTKEKPVTR